MYVFTMSHTGIRCIDQLFSYEGMIFRSYKEHFMDPFLIQQNVFADLFFFIQIRGKGIPNIRFPRTTTRLINSFFS